MQKSSFLIILLFSALFTHSQSSGITPGRTAEKMVAKKTLRYECPLNVQIGMQKISGGWTAGYGEGIMVSFSRAEIIVAEKTMSCVYEMKNCVTPFIIIQSMPKGYTCEFEKLPGNAQNRKFICQPIATPPVIIPKSN